MKAVLISTVVVACVLLACVPLAFVAGRASANAKHEQATLAMNPSGDHLARHVHGSRSDRIARARRFQQFAADRANNEDDLPYRYSTLYQTPRYYQEDRGTCWDFATIGILEQSYRQNGIEKGFLKEEEYVRLNEQAYGLSVIEACKDHADVCDVVGDFVFHNSTEGGEVWWLYNLKELYTKVLPSSVCPYTDPEHEHDCPGMQEAIAKNPIKFNVKSMTNAYNVMETKRLMYKNQRPLAWSSEMHNTVYFFPCNDPYWKGRVECSSRLAVKCPTDRYYGSQTCARVLSSMFNMDGEFFIHGQTIGEGGHAMNVVGYNDEFTTKQGQTGGFIIRNSWHDLTYGTSPNGRGGRGSHSMAYWMQNISAWDERAICPGPLNPENWISCVEQEAGPHRRIRQGPLKDDEYDISETCLNDKFMENLLSVSLQPTEFECIDDTVCDTDSKYRYFLISLEHSVEQDLAKVCMLRYDTKTKEQDTYCTPFHIPAQIAYWFRPIKAQRDALADDEDLCGFWFWPYEMLNKQVGMYNNYYSTYFEIEWDDQSYAANSAQHTDLDYSFIKSSTFTQKKMDFETPSPFPKGRYD